MKYIFKNLLLIIIVLSSSSFFSQYKKKKYIIEIEKLADFNYKQNVGQFLKSLKLTDSLNLSEMPASFQNVNLCTLSAISDSILTKEEIEKVKKGIINRKNIRWSKSDIPNAKIISKNAIKYFFDKTDIHGNSSTYCMFSRPEFLRNYTYCLFLIENCWSQSGTAGKFCLYKKIENDWIEVETYCDWIN